MSSSKDSQGVPAGSKGSWSSFLKSIASFNGDLSSLTAPPFILSPTSLTEYSAYWAEHPSIFVAPAREADPEKRALLVLKWFLTTLHQQYCSRSEKLGSEKKPLNPFLGELFIGKWSSDPEVGETTLISEQVSHHPPATAYAIQNEKHGVQLQGYNAQKASFSNTIQIKQIGHALLTLTPPGADPQDPAQQEQYLITLPYLHVESLIYGTPFMELEKTTRIVSSTGYTAKIDYSGKGWLSGKKNTFNASLYKESEGEKKPLYTADGQWSKSFSIKNARTKDVIDTYTVDENPTTPLQVAPLEEQDLYESRRAWRDVAGGILKGDMDSVSVAKGTIENAQRELRKVENSENTEWQRRFFKRVDGTDEQFQNLFSRANLESLESDKTGGVWRFDPSKAVDAKPPYHSIDVPGKGLGVPE
ncbi:OSBP family protein [Aspergillus candidus]|uniref:Putative oxysterol binding protein n=1 Tax=Aspergillus candidus TaxID=41067 RepID=A0A2I2FJG0_ASPCN|nr:putative oxysterol binding protein [Aspergillus candidus]PLB40759.1 putative oxysterol binding protein [Aspergillus candidus]